MSSSNSEAHLLFEAGSRQSVHTTGERFVLLVVSSSWDELSGRCVLWGIFLVVLHLWPCDCSFGASFEHNHGNWREGPRHPTGFPIPHSVPERDRKMRRERERGGEEMGWRRILPQSCQCSVKCAVVLEGSCGWAWIRIRNGRCGNVGRYSFVHYSTRLAGYGHHDCVYVCERERVCVLTSPAPPACGQTCSWPLSDSRPAAVSPCTYSSCTCCWAEPEKEEQNTFQTDPKINKLVIGCSFIV